MLLKWHRRFSSLVLIVLVKITRHYNHKNFDTVFYMEVFYPASIKYKIKQNWWRPGRQLHSSSVIRQKGESQNRCFKKTKHTKFSEKQTFLTTFLDIDTEHLLNDYFFYSSFTQNFLNRNFSKFLFLAGDRKINKIYQRKLKPGNGLWALEIAYWKLRLSG